MRRVFTAAALFLVAVAALAGCGGTSPTTSSARGTKAIDVTITGASTTPSGQTIDVAVGQPIELQVTADAPGEIHVHSSPEEQEFRYDSGTSTIEVKPIPAPGRVTVESHTLNKTLFTLLAR